MTVYLKMIIFIKNHLSSIKLTWKFSQIMQFLLYDQIINTYQPMSEKTQVITSPQIIGGFTHYRG